MKDCTKCGTPTGELELFPGGVCLACWAASPEGQRMPTGDEVVAMWGGPVRKRIPHPMDDDPFAGIPNADDSDNAPLGALGTSHHKATSVKTCSRTLSWWAVSEYDDDCRECGWRVGDHREPAWDPQGGAA